jgi:hypothetical protein
MKIYMKHQKPITFLILLLISLGFTSLLPAQITTHSKESITSKENQEVGIKVISVRSLNKSRAQNSAVFGDFIEVRLNKLDYLLSPDDTCCTNPSDSKIYLNINGIPCFDIPAYRFDRIRNTIVFHLERDSNTLKKITQLFPFPWSRIELSSISICTSGNPPLPTKVKNFEFHFTSPMIGIYSLILVIVIFGSFFILVKYTNIIRVGDKNTSYSLAMSQLAFWTLLISTSVIYIWLTTTKLPNLTPSTLALLGISIATTAGAKVITYSRQENPEEAKSENFFIDILSDFKNVNIYRFQMFIWTLILGFIYVQKVIYYQQIPEFSETYLMLMGISSGAYVLLKATDKGDQQTPAQNNSPNSFNNVQGPAMG